MSKNIVLLSDGTGNSSSKIFKTNVWRTFQTLDLTDTSKQIAYYDNGVGTSSFKLFAVLGGVFGFGLKRNVIDIYSFCCRNYVAGDRIYGFGFSRGAFTMRVVAGLIARQGLVPYTGDEIALARYATSAYRDYRRRFNSTEGLVTPLRNLRDVIIRAYRHLAGIGQYDPNEQIEVERIHFLGLWDTVDAYGGPIEEITRAIDYWYWPLSMPDRFMNAKVHRACHALALEDERDAFRPVIWDERYVRNAAGKLQAIDSEWEPEVSAEWKDKLKDIDKKRLSQVWFVGVHSDIGGGYPQDGLSYVTLDWMLDRAQPFGLLLDPLQHVQMKSLINPYDKLNDSRHGLAGYYRYKPRNIHEIYNAPPYKPSMSSDFEYMRGELINRDPEEKISSRMSWRNCPTRQRNPMGAVMFGRQYRRFTWRCSTVSRPLAKLRRRPRSRSRRRGTCRSSCPRNTTSQTRPAGSRRSIMPEIRSRPASMKVKRFGIWCGGGASSIS
jgi:uncharacterized protein (DUF2235 family)